MLCNNTKELANHKLVLLYVLDSFSVPLTNTQLTEFVMENDYMNYFMFQQFLSDLVKIGMIEHTQSENTFFYLITEKGKKTLDYFKERLGESLINKLNKDISKRRHLWLKETQISADYIKKNDKEYIVDLKVVENDITLIDLKISVASNKQAKQICEKWKSDASNLYGSIINLII
ncbi:MAG: DUF4364 family protein [Anaeromicrobium sp.]|jgi:predicted transcriptional regulator|uniref:DUF4364 family protein n=1 Tax=Anaeromicrobium sp. TaxID=1929132 RepID=UPI0025E0705E|nr:DUF4364 family protein [Anaeromicrobium sp.]MCT4594164.1 DUF4364 family protein [Anaeromicrobium sp.]